MKISFFYFSIFFLSIYVVPLALSCVCPSNSTTIIPGSKPEELSLSPQDEMINGVNYGKLISVNNLIYLSNDVAISSSISSLSHKCPKGYRPPTLEEYSSLLTFYSSGAYNTLTTRANYDPSLSYMTSAKTYPAVTNGGDNNAWVYSCLVFDKTKQTVRTDNCNTYWGKASQRVKCVMDTNTTREIQLSGLPNQDFIPGNEYSLTIDNNNAVSYSWNFLTDKLSGTQKSFSYKPINDGCKALVVKATLFGGISVLNCYQLFVTSESRFTPNKTDLYELSQEEEKIDGINYGRLISLNGNIWLTSDVTTGSTTGANIPHKCPSNYRPPTLDELNGVLNFLGASSYYILTRVANYNTSLTYMTNTKSFPGESGDNSWKFKGMSLYPATKSLAIRDVHTYWEKSKSGIKCVRFGVDNVFSIKGQPISDLNVGQKCLFEVVQSNSIQCVWDLGTNNTNNNQKNQCSIEYSPDSMGRKKICVNVTVFGGAQKSKCFEFYVQPGNDNTNNNGGSGVELSQFEEVFDAVSAGKLIRFGGLIWLQNDFPVQRSNNQLITSCPKGFAPPSQELYNSIVSSLGEEAFYTLNRQLNYSVAYNYMTNNKTNVSATGIDSYIFQGIKLSENPNKVSPVSINTYWSYESCRVKCVLNNISALNTFIKGKSFDELEVGLKYELELIEPNAISVLWNLGNGTVSNNSKIVFAANKEEIRNICVNVSVMGWFNKSSCFPVIIKNQQFELSRNQNEIVRFSNDIQFSAEDEVIDGENYGKLIRIGTQLWISKDIPIQKSINSLSYQCPIGFRAPFMEEYLNLIGVLRENTSEILLSQAKFNSSLSYMTMTKSFFREGGNGGANEDWVFKGLVFAGQRVEIQDVSTYWSTELRVVRCIMNDFDFPFELKGLPRVDLYQGSKYTVSLAITNALAYKWKIGNSEYRNKSIDFEAITLGKNSFCITVNIFAGFIRSFCQNVFVNLKYEKDVNPIFTQEKYHNISLPGIKINSNANLHFASASAPLAPNNDGNSYVLYSELLTNDLYVIELYPNGTLIPNAKCNLSRKGVPLDITATPWGFATYIRYTENSKASLLAFYKNCSIKFEQTIMNNVNGTGSPQIAIDQINFYQDVNGNKPFGMAVMYNPHNGRLSYAREKIALVFAHYNHFGVREDGSNNDHTGDSFIIFDEATGNDSKLAYSWGCSHSLNQEILWDGEKFITASLGDAYPMGISVSRCEAVYPNGFIEPITGKRNRLDCESSSTLIEGKIPGNGWGDAAGRLGGLMLLNESDYVMVYSRRNSSVMFQNTPPEVTNDKNEIGFVRFDQNLALKKYVVLENEPFNNVLHSVRYGDKILVGYSKSTCLKGNGNFVCPGLRKDELLFMKLYDLDGNKLGEINIQGLPSGDDFEVLLDGRVAWISYNSDGSLAYHYLDQPGK